MTHDADYRWMQMAIGVSRRGLGHVWPNPSVGCVIVRDNRVLAAGWTQPGGRPHAEAFALNQAQQANIDVRDATAFVTLEPCAHFGKTPPCADALIAAGIRRVVVAIEDPDPRVAGRGIAQLRSHGIEVVTGIAAEEAKDVLGGYLMRCESGRPLMAMKTATSLDSKIALSNGQSKWMTGPEIRQFGHLLRAHHDAMMVGIGTIRADDPMLDCRLPGMAQKSPKIVIIDPHFSISLNARILADERKHIIVGLLSHDKAQHDRCIELEARGHMLIYGHPAPDGGIAAIDIALALGAHGITSVLIEGGAQTQRRFLQAGLVDRLWWFRGAKMVGAGGVDALAIEGYQDMAALPCWTLHQSRVFGDDRVDMYRRA